MEKEPWRTPPPIASAEDVQGAIDEVALMRVFMKTLSGGLDSLTALKEREPGEVIEELVQALPEKPKVISREEREAFLNETFFENGALMSIDTGEVSALEAYLIFLIARTSPEVLQVNKIGAATDSSFSKVESAQVLRDEVRTKRFLQGIALSVKELDASRDDEIIVCDAGCGALPILGVYAALQSPKVRSVCIENNPQAIEMAQALVVALKLEDRVTIVNADAREYVPQKPIDLLVSETMDAGLLNEPMCEILHRLKQYSASEAKILPQQVTLYVASASLEAYRNAKNFTLIDKYTNPVLPLDWKEADVYRAGEAPIHVQASIALPNTHEDLVLLVSSEVLVCDGVPPLLFNESRLSSSMPVGRVQQKRSLFRKRPKIATISYKAGDKASQVKLDSVAV